VKRLSIVLAFAAGCSWSAFDDLSDTTPVHAQEKPDGVKASDYGFAIANGTMTGETTGGRLSVLSTGNGNYSTLNFDASGKTSVGDSEALGIHTIDTLTNNALLVSDGAGNVAVIDNSNVGTIVAVHGVATALSVDTQVGTSQKPDAATFAGARIVIAGASQSPGFPNLFAVSGGTVLGCLANTEAAPTVVSAAAIAADDTHLWVWTKTGEFFALSLAQIDTCTVPPPTPVVVAPAANTTLMAGAPTNGGHIDIVANKYAILTAFDTPSTTAGQVSIIDLTTAKPTLVGTAMSAQGVHSATFANFDGMAALVLGFPNRPVGSTANGGAIDIHLFDMTTGVLTGTPVQSFSDSQAGSNLLLGRAVTTMTYNGKPIIVASASSVIYAYYQTQIYQKR
jgi:hypothetical protein